MEKYATVVKKLNDLNAEPSERESYTQLWLPPQKLAENDRAGRTTAQTADASYGPHAASEPGSRGDSNRDRRSQSAAFLGAKAIGTLQQRSHHEGPYEKPQDAPPFITEPFVTAPFVTAPFVTEPSVYEDSLITQEIQRLELKAIEINNRSQQQADDIVALKQAAQQATVAFGRQGIHNHPQLEVVSRFFDRYATSHVPMIERDERGHFVLSDYTINLRRAEEEAIENAAVLRSGRASSSAMSVQPFAQPIGRKPAGEKTDGRKKSAIARSRKGFNLISLPAKLSRALNNIVSLLKSRRVAGRMLAFRNGSAAMQQGFPNRSKSPGYSASTNSHSPDGVPLATEQYMGNHPGRREFSLVDGAIWFSASAIVRIALEAVVDWVPVLQPLLWMAPLVLFGSALYLLFGAKSSNHSLMYRLALSGLGLFLGNPF